MVWEPWRPLTLAEQHVDFHSHLAHILDRRALVERQAAPTARRLAIASVDLRGLPPLALSHRLSGLLTIGLEQTARFGYTEARRELASIRTVKAAVAPEEIVAGWTLQSLQRRIAARARQAAETVTHAVGNLVTSRLELSRADLILAAVKVAERSLHNTVLDLVGETLNWGRLTGAMSLDVAPTFAMRSEIMDKATCAACDTLDGAILRVGSAELMAYMPPAGCFGGGRCRGVLVFADHVSDVRGPDTTPGPQPALPPIPPVRLPRRKAA